MSDEQLTDDQSHYEISLTAGQAFVAFVLLLLSLAASFAFGLMIGRGQSDDRLVVRKEPTVINEGSVAAAKRNDGKIVELGVSGDEFKQPAKTDTTVTEPAATTATTDTTATIVPAAPATVVPATDTQPKVAPPKPAAPQRRDAAVPAGATPAVQQPVYAQLLSTSEQKTAEALAAKLIDGGFTGAYVERAGTAFKVRIRFASEADARVAEPRLKAFSKDVWIVK